MKAMFFLFLFHLNSFAFATDFSAINIHSWTKENLSEDHLRFTSNSYPGTVLHIQIESFEPNQHWNNDSLKSDIEKMEKMRNGMASLLGMKDYRISRSIYDGKKLELTGSYLRWGKTHINFKEYNFYHLNHFLQLKFISSTKLPTDDEIKKIISELNPDQVVID